SFAQVAQSSRDLLPSERSTRPPPVLNPEGITLVKPKNENVDNFETNKKLITELLRKKDPAIRLRSFGKIYGGGLKLVSASLDDAKVIKDLLCDTEDNDLHSSFEFSIPPRRSPQIIVYNVDKKVEPDVFKKGLLAKNLFLSDANNTPKFKVEFNIPARNKELVHWILTINPKTFHEIMDKEGLYFEFSRLRFSEFIGIKQCKKCFLFGHTTKQCKQETPRKCDNCGENWSEKHRCKKRQCINCTVSNSKYKTTHGTNHNCLDPMCKAYLKQKEFIRKRTDYGL
ncbi:hypothetical protein AVEN_274940-1, partial [Araneus ventricosus]